MTALTLQLLNQFSGIANELIVRLTCNIEETVRAGLRPLTQTSFRELGFVPESRKHDDSSDQLRSVNIRHPD